VAGPVLSLVGKAYEDAGVAPLRILVLGVVPLSFIQAYFSACRATNRLREAIATGIATGVAGVAATAAAGVLYGLIGIAVCWVLVLAAASLWSIGRLRRLLRREADEDGPSGRRVPIPLAQGVDETSWHLGAPG